jgi:hypothetical protein
VKFGPVHRYDNPEVPELAFTLTLVCAQVKGPLLEAARSGGVWSHSTLTKAVLVQPLDVLVTTSV